MSSKGYDIFFTNVDEKDKMKCKVCKSDCIAKRKIIGATCFAEAVGGGKHEHDYFKCPYSEKPWHQQALNIVRDIENLSSPSVKKIMEKDLKKIIKKGLEKKEKNYEI